jgi:glyoxalase family protein
MLLAKVILSREVVMQLSGYHHVTAVTSNAKGNVDFYTQVLGMRMVKKTVNQDDVTAYHLYYGDETGSPGTAVTFFDWAMIGPQQRGTGEINMLSMRVGSAAALAYWSERLTAHGVQHSGVHDWHGHAALTFADPEGQQLMLINDGGRAGGTPWAGSPVPAEHYIKGIFGSGVVVRNREPFETVIRHIYGLELIDEQVDVVHPHRTNLLYAAGHLAGGALAVQVAPDLPPSRLGHGGVHHIAFRIADDDAANYWIERLHRSGLQSTPIIDRFYFHSVYARVPGNILIELATDGPGFVTDEPLETLGESLALPPFLEGRRASIEAGLRPIS